jgi:hypothetical protein
MLNRKGFRDFTLKWKLAFVAERKKKEEEKRTTFYAIINYASCRVKCFGDEILKVPATNVFISLLIHTHASSTICLHAQHQVKRDGIKIEIMPLNARAKHH